ncbi:glycosyltransferase [Bordetella petrii]|uniref:Glycosyltransferase n=1 Tax=Bordetella petrii TaxID=94624 RepID=A0ABT7VXT6_9BORD|nr:glycosyltransferase [Bordetella petrii]MDM9557751.1 glycosyltransferase [Bordetella petrii]
MWRAWPEKGISLLLDNLSANPRSVPSAFVAAVTGARHAAECLPKVLMYYPALKLNPFHELLYARAGEAETAVIPMADVTWLTEIGWTGRLGIHLHWLQGVLKGARSEEEARSMAQGFESLMAGWKERGIKIIWTVHNILPHQRRFPNAEVLLHKATAKYADLIHVMNKETAKLTRPWYQIPKSRAFYLPHPSYANWYGNVIGRSRARQMLGIADHEFVFLFFGSIQPYKGLIELVQAFDALKTRTPGRRLRLLIVGPNADPEYTNSLKERAVDAGVSLVPHGVPDEHIQVYFNASDAVVAPYLRSLNSGVALLAATFRKSMVAPDTGAMAEVLGARHPLLYDRTQDGLIDAMRRAMSYTPEARYFDEILERYEPGKISALFFAEVSKLLDGGAHLVRKRPQGRKK